MGRMEGVGGLDFVFVIVLFAGVHLAAPVSIIINREMAVKCFLPAHTLQP